jgi:hypothetical protein
MTRWQAGWLVVQVALCTETLRHADKWWQISMTVATFGLFTILTWPEFQ